ncbi:hypothetical protein [Campylobacter showae]|uniref:Uncharacterized protein n=1 Tax=Campylobacter showae CSUNSWCD TaxID=1244083 RepID=M5IK42_9BACT|nr:hypothetical protein [Campylobacter showae]EKU11350.1 hypothetical protein CSUNSWCD_1976 [Campylobacter showae CSUNSWCD]
MRFKPLKFKLFSVGGDAQIWIKFGSNLPPAPLLCSNLTSRRSPLVFSRTQLKRSNLTSNLTKRAQI